MSNNKERRGVTPAKAARDSAILVVTIAIGVVAIAAVVAICVASMSVAITKWHDIAWAVTVGGSFWGGFTVAVLGLFAGAWLLDTAWQLDKDKHYRAIFRLKVAGRVGIGLSVLVQASLLGLWISGELGKLTTPQVLALGFPISCTMMYLLYQSYAAAAERT
ncbi:hypothetical protein O9649_24860 [Achromobacter dolens]|uniref:hypothetical protein n=1 Tax=Achromobacter dolens TaxID=1287738 RepID=UPI0022B918A9|nr:hypothetical protein [Achromobacter dolens]MCZ8411022.1 hypothetical protein [Achromobacter dolens]